MAAKSPIIRTCHFHFRMLQSLIIYEILIPLLHIFELHGAQLNEDKIVFNYFQQN